LFAQPAAPHKIDKDKIDNNAREILMTLAE
jgi:hypothetical protein